MVFNYFRPAQRLGRLHTLLARFAFPVTYPSTPNQKNSVLAQADGGIGNLALVLRMSAGAWKRGIVGVASVFQFLLESDLGSVVPENC